MFFQIHGSNSLLGVVVKQRFDAKVGANGAVSGRQGPLKSHVSTEMTKMATKRIQPRHIVSSRSRKKLGMPSAEDHHIELHDNKPSSNVRLSSRSAAHKSEGDTRTSVTATDASLLENK